MITADNTKLVVDVKLWNKYVGTAEWNIAEKKTEFRYNPEFINEGLNLSPVLMKPDPVKLYSFESLNPITFKYLPPMLADSLPDDFGNHILQSYLQSKGKHIMDLSPIERLCYVGKRGMGALEYEPNIDLDLNDQSVLDLTEIVDVANKVYSQRADLSLDIGDDKSIANLIQIGTSAGGMRAKAIVAIDQTNNTIRAGDIIHQKDHTYWLMKLDGVSNEGLGDPQGYGKIEYAYFQMALDSGIEMNETRLVNEGNRSHFMTKRFDRTDAGEKLHMQTLGGLTGWDYNRPRFYTYEQTFQLIREMNLDHNNKDQLFRRMVFNVIMRNQDDHVKNLSFLMNNKGEWNLSPAYDMTFAFNPKARGWTGGHQMLINGKSDDIIKSDLMNIGMENNIRNRKDIIDQITEVATTWKTKAKDLDIPKEQIDTIGKTFRMSYASREIKK